MKKLKSVSKEISNLFKKLLSTKKGKIIFAICVVIIGFIFWRLLSTKNKPTQIQTEIVKKGTIVSSVTASGSIISSNIENITTQASGTVKKVYVNDGDVVTKGQLIAEIELDTLGQQNQAQAYSSYISAVVGMNSANNSYRSAQASVDTVLDSLKGHDTDESFAQKETRTKAEVAKDNAYDNLKTAQARLTSASLDYKTNSPYIYAPIAGKVKSVTVAEGMNLGATENASGGAANQRIATIATEGLPIATFNVSEIEVTKVTTDQKATITLDSITDKTFTGQVVSVDRVGSTSNNVTSYPVIVKLDTNSDQILPNMAATANIIVDTKSDVLVISSSAVNYQGEQTSVKVVKEGQEQNVSVVLGISNDTQIEVISGLNEGDIIVSSTTATSTSSTQSTQSRSSGGTFFSGGEVRVPGAGGLR